MIPSKKLEDCEWKERSDHSTIKYLHSIYLFGGFVCTLQFFNNNNLLKILVGERTLNILMIFGNMIF